MSSDLPDTSARHGPENLAILLREPFRAMTDRLHERLAERGHPAIRHAHGAVFEWLDDDGTRVGVLAERARMTKQSMAQLVEHLEAHGYVERVPDPTDGRARLIRPAPLGLEAAALAAPVVAQVEAEWTAHLGAETMAGLRAALVRLREVTDPWA
jgi:DNA-binding MarR family transcriptional regulator